MYPPKIVDNVKGGVMSVNLVWMQRECACNRHSHQKRTSSDRAPNKFAVQKFHFFLSLAKNRQRWESNPGPRCCKTYCVTTEPTDNQL